MCCYHNHLFYCYLQKHSQQAIHNILVLARFLFFPPWNVKHNSRLLFAFTSPANVTTAFYLHTWCGLSIKTVWLMPLIHYDYDAVRRRKSKAYCNQVPLVLQNMSQRRFPEKSLSAHDEFKVVFRLCMHHETSLREIQFESHESRQRISRGRIKLRCESLWMKTNTERKA